LTAGSRAIPPYNPLRAPQLLLGCAAGAIPIAQYRNVATATTRPSWGEPYIQTRRRCPARHATDPRAVPSPHRSSLNRTADLDDPDIIVQHVDPPECRDTGADHGRDIVGPRLSEQHAFFGQGIDLNISLRLTHPCLYMGIATEMTKNSEG
jgi:hypothetical protein